MEYDDEFCKCNHSKICHGQTSLDEHGGICHRCECELYTWVKFVKITSVP